jgi:hypothetical protein
VEEWLLVNMVYFRLGCDGMNFIEISSRAKQQKSHIGFAVFAKQSQQTAQCRHAASTR